MLERPSVPQNIEQPQSILDVLLGLLMYSQIGKEPIVTGMPGMVRGPILGQAAAPAMRNMLRQGSTPAKDLVPYDPAIARNRLLNYGEMSANGMPPPHTLSNPVRASNPGRFGSASDKATPLAPGMSEQESLLAILLRALLGTSRQ